MSKKTANREVFTELVVGAFVALVFLGLAVFTIVISGKNLFNDEVFGIEVVLPDAMGLRPNDPVIARGTTVGSVKDVRFQPDGVHVKAQLEAPVQFHEGYSITVVSTSILGGRQLVLKEGEPDAPVVENVNALVGQKPSDLMEDATAAIARVREFLDTDVLTNLVEFSESLKEIGRRLEDGEGTIGRLLAEDSVYTNLDATVANVRLITDRLERGEGTVGKLLSTNDVVHADIRSALASAKEALDTVKSAAANIDKISARVERGEGTIGQLLSTNDTAYADLKAALANIRKVTDDLKGGQGLAGRLVYDKKLGEDASQLLENLNGVSERLAKGSGTLGKLMTDQELYNEVNALIKDVRQIVDNYRDTTPVSTFGSLIMGGL